MDDRKTFRKICLLLVGLSLIIVTLACATIAKPTPSPQPVIEATHTPDFQRTADYQAALATQLATTQTALQGQQIKPTLEAIYAGQCTLPADQAGAGKRWIVVFLRIDGADGQQYPRFDYPRLRSDRQPLGYNI